MAFESIGAKAEDVEPKHAAQECLPGHSQEQPEKPGDPSLLQACQRSIPARTQRTDSSVPENEMKAKVKQSLDPTQIRREFTSTKKFILEKIQEAKTSRTFLQRQLLFHLEEQGLVDVTVDEEVYSGSVHTSLKIRHPSSALFSQTTLSELKHGYCYYDKFQKWRDINGREKDILVNREELETKFHTNLPALKHVWVVDYKEGRTPDTDQDRRPITIDYIGALVKLEKDPETINNLLSNFLATFFKILADKSFELKQTSMT